VKTGSSFNYGSPRSSKARNFIIWHCLGLIVTYYVEVHGILLLVFAGAETHGQVVIGGMNISRLLLRDFLL